MKNLGKIYSFGDLPYHLIRPVLFKINNPEQLREVEMYSTYVEGETEELWRRLIARAFPNWEKKNYVPKDPRSWYKVYEKYKREEAQEIAEAEAKLAGAFGALKSEADQQKSLLVSQRLMPRLPKEGRGSGWRRDVGRDVPDHLSWGGGSRTKSVVKKAMREAREAANRRTLSTPTGQLRIPEGQIRKAPQALINDYRIKQQPFALARPPRSKPKTEAQMADDAARRERERRLLNIKISSSARPEQVVSDSDSDDYDNENHGGAGRGRYLDDLFSDEEVEDEAPPPSRKPTKPPVKPSPSTAPTRPSGSNILSNRSKTLLSSTAPRRVVQSATPPVRAEPTPRHPQQVPQQASPLPRPHRPPPTAASSPPGRAHPGPSSPPPKPPVSQPGQAGSLPPAGLLRKRKAPVNIFMRKKPRT
jgi:elongin-A